MQPNIYVLAYLAFVAACLCLAWLVTRWRGRTADRVLTATGRLNRFGVAIGVGIGVPFTVWVAVGLNIVPGSKPGWGYLNSSNQLATIPFDAGNAGTASGLVAVCEAGPCVVSVASVTTTASFVQPKVTGLGGVDTLVTISLSGTVPLAVGEILQCVAADGSGGNYQIRSIGAGSISAVNRGGPLPGFSPTGKGGTVSAGAVCQQAQSSFDNYLLTWVGTGIDGVMVLDGGTYVPETSSTQGGLSFTAVRAMQFADLSASSATTVSTLGDTVILVSGTFDPTNILFLPVTGAAGNNASGTAAGAASVCDAGGFPNVTNVGGIALCANGLAGGAGGLLTGTNGTCGSGNTSAGLGGDSTGGSGAGGGYTGSTPGVTANHLSFQQTRASGLGANPIGGSIGQGTQNIPGFGVVGCGGGGGAGSTTGGGGGGGGTGGASVIVIANEVARNGASGCGILTVGFPGGIGATVATGDAGGGGGGHGGGGGVAAVWAFIYSGATMPGYICSAGGHGGTGGTGSGNVTGGAGGMGGGAGDVTKYNLSVSTQFPAAFVNGALGSTGYDGGPSPNGVGGDGGAGAFNSLAL